MVLYYIYASERRLLESPDNKTHIG